jgi:hypothetical protein
MLIEFSSNETDRIFEERSSIAAELIELDRTGGPAPDDREDRTPGGGAPNGPQSPSDGPHGPIVPTPPEVGAGL